MKKFDKKLSRTLELSQDLAGDALDLANAGLKTLHEDKKECIKIAAFAATAYAGVKNNSKLLTAAGAVGLLFSMGDIKKVRDDFFDNVAQEGEEE